MDKDMKSEQPHYLVCVPWGEELVLSVKRKCVECNRAVAMDARNINIYAEKGLQAICEKCAKKKMAETKDGWECAGGLVGGKHVPLAETGLTREQIDEWIKK